MLKLHDIVILKEDDKITGIRKGTVGAIVYIHDNGRTYTVEFFDDDKDTIVESFKKEFVAAELKINNGK